MGLGILSPLFVLIAVLIKLDSSGPVFFLQERIGRNFLPFQIVKFRTMKVGAILQGPLITVGGDKRVTRIGIILRKLKIDELPQLINILKGEMSFVGPRPEVKKYVEHFREDYMKLLTVRPGITDPASVRFSDEEVLLASSADWERDYIEKILPEKIRLAQGYIENHTLCIDIRLIMKTLLKI